MRIEPITRFLFVLVFLFPGYQPLLTLGKEKSQNPEKSKRVHIEHQIKDIEGWKVHVDDSLLTGEYAELGKVAMRVLANKLYRITLVMEEEKLKHLREVPIFLDHKHELRSMQFHPSSGWLRDHGYDTAMTKAVHIPRASGLINQEKTQTQQWVILHELSHAYHNRVLGFDDKSIRAAYFRAKASKIYEKVLHIRGHKTKHYALTNEKEFFAEMSESFFGTNDFYPFVRGELKEADPETYRLLEKIWGKRR